MFARRLASTSCRRHARRTPLPTSSQCVSALAAGDLSTESTKSLKAPMRSRSPLLPHHTASTSSFSSSTSSTSPSVLRSSISTDVSEMSVLANDCFAFSAASANCSSIRLSILDTSPSRLRSFR